MSGENVLPNCIPSSHKIDWNLSRSGANWLYLYCANCGCDGGRVRECDLPNKEEYAFYLCDPCAEKYGAVTNTMMVPDEVVFKKITEAQIEKYGAPLTAQQLIIELQDETSLISKLKKEKF
jgi:hypothetical protein